MYHKYCKRLFDILFSQFLIMLLSPIFVLIAIAIMAIMGWPIIFTQDRPGLEERVFKIYKFRSMLDKNDKYGNPLPDHQRITKFGKFLRESSIDELPELFNVLIGDMSFVGPRPLIIRYLPHYTKREQKRHDVRPGITGLAQVNGRNFLDWDKRLEMDVYYVENLSFLLDLKIIIKSIITVIKREGVGLESMADLDVLRKQINESNMQS